MNLGGLSPDKAPPVDAPLGLFYLMPPFLALAGLVLAWQGDQVLLSRWTPAALAVTHFLVLGALAPVMCGALLQISPVLFGTPFPRVRLVARLTSTGLGIGALLIGTGFLAGYPSMLLSGGAVAAAGLVVFLAGSWRALAHGSAATAASLWTVRLSAAALAVTVLFGLMLALSRAGWLTLPGHLGWVDTHVSWGLAGWIGLLLAGVGMEIIPLFYISPPFAVWLKRALPFAVFGLLVLITLLATQVHAVPMLNGAVVALFLVHLLYNAAALYVEQRRQRPRRDANLWLWQGSHLAVFGAFAAWFGGAAQSLVGVLLLAAALAFMIGSLMKIVPFLTWLDLHQRRAAGGHLHVSLPRLGMLLPEKVANGVAFTLGAATIAVLLGPFLPLTARLGGGLLVLCAMLLGLSLARAGRSRSTVIDRFGSPPPISKTG